MHEIGVCVVWLSLQVTIVAVGTALFYWCLRRRGPLMRSLVISSSLVVTLLLATFVLSPWPRWTTQQTQQRRSEVSHVEKTIRENNPTDLAESPLPQQKTIELDSVWSSAWTGFVEGLKNKQSVENQDAPLTWPAFIGFLFLGGMALGFLRLCVGYILLKREVEHSIELDHSAARELLDRLLMEQDHPPVLCLRETQRLATAAVAGWWRPIILLPASWQAWSTEQLKAVLTHELSHIQQRDFLSNLCAEISRSIYFYHPLMHWLVARLRLEQELVADAAAAEAAGGPESYLVILAEMAMAQSNRGVRGPARAFLPTQSTFLRRIDMLKGKKTFRGTVPASTRAFAVMVIVLMGLLAVGFRGDRVSLAQDVSPNVADSEEVKRTPEKFRIDFVPNNALAIIAIRPAKILDLKVMKPIRQLIELDEEKRKEPGAIPFNPKEIETGIVFFLPPDPQTVNKSPLNKVIVVQVRQVFEQKSVMESFNGLKYISQKYGDRTYFKVPKTTSAPALLFLNDRTLMIADNETALLNVINTLESRSVSRWEKKWESLENGSLAVLLNMRLAREMVWSTGASIGFSNATTKGLVSPIWENTDIISLGMNINQKISLKSILYQDVNGTRVQKTLTAIFTLSENVLQQYRKGIRVRTLEERLAVLDAIDVAEKLVRSVEVKQEGENVSLTMSLPATSGAQLVAALMPAITQAQKASIRTRSRNNVKQIMLALHKFHDKHKHFPSAVLLGPDGKTPYSWRVALLPFLDQQILYDEYNKNEPWNSEHNKKVLAKMPVVYRCPADNGAENYTSYFGVVGQNTMFGKTGQLGKPGPFGGALAAGTDSRGVDNLAGSSLDGVRLRDIVDGTSNTIAVVETKREIPWTKPEDLTYDGKKLPKLGGFYQGGFFVGRCDGAVLFTDQNIDQNILRNLFLINDRNQLDPQR
ncbi:M56 family metallopeptidase [uncultured Gimesia sp.]|uniref:M56 family metallopeptidase n=1 Tax=uncultured Gimesia sp. TaxID=1678688 RepID=UPI0030DA0AE3|tara:strand:- start:13194 stop:15980 length:2787 start_codon:yes stop_codon:yes gene_type:complete